jgi:3-oxoacyl-[acyl-carrier-protein] synthase II
VPRVVVTGMGVISPIGQSIAAFFESLTSTRSGVSLVPEDLCASNHPLVAARVAFDGPAHFPAHQISQLDRATQFALVAARQALDSAGDSTFAIARDRFGVYWGTGLGGATSIEESYRQLYAGSGRVRPTSVVLAMNNAAGGNVSIANGLRGPVINVSSACSSSATAIGEAYRAIKHGYADALVAGGSEALITNGNLRAWDAMQALARPDAADASRSCKPFAADRTGIVLGEGAAALVLERADIAEGRGAHVYAEVTGYGNAADASHISKPSADGQVRAMRLALDDAGLDASEIGYLNAHGTATIVGDPIETTAIRTVFGDRATGLPVSSTKALHGHLMGAAGALEMIAAITAMEQNLVPPTAHLDCPDAACDLDYVPNVARAAELRAVMSNSFGFGGMNSVLIARRFAN